MVSPVLWMMCFANIRSRHTPLIYCKGITRQHSLELGYTALSSMISLDGLHSFQPPSV